MPAPKGNDSRLTAIYVLRDPRDGGIRYVGKTLSPSKRLEGHAWPSVSDYRPVANWCRKLRAFGFRPQMEVLRWVDDWESEERSEIAARRAAGANLLNIEEGGNSGSHLTAATGTYPAYMWAVRFAVRTKRPELLEVLREAWAKAKANGPHEMARLDGLFFSDLPRIRQRGILVSLSRTAKRRRAYAPI